MKNIILFKAKRKDNDEWVYGQVVVQTDTETHFYMFANFKAKVGEKHIDILSYDLYEVQPETIQQL